MALEWSWRDTGREEGGRICSCVERVWRNFWRDAESPPSSKIQHIDSTSSAEAFLRSSASSTSETKGRVLSLRRLLLVPRFQFSASQNLFEPRCAIPSRLNCAASRRRRHGHERLDYLVHSLDPGKPFLFFVVGLERDARPFREAPALSSALMSDLARGSACDLMASKVIFALRSPSSLVRMSRTFCSCSSLSIEIHILV